MKQFFDKIPKLPLSALIFYVFVFALWKFNLIPSPLEIIGFLESLYNNYGLVGLFIASFLEGIVYLGLYFPGSFIIVLVVLLSDGKFISLLNISLIVALALTLTSMINYVLGRHFVARPLRETKEIKTKRKMSKGFFLSLLHPNALAFYFFNLGLKKRNFWNIIFVPLIIIPYGFLLASLFYLAKPILEENSENPYVMITFISFWLIISFILGYKNKKW